MLVEHRAFDLEIENFDYVKSIIRTDFDTFSGRLLEKYFIEKIKLTKQYHMIGQYWELGNQNEIDIVAINEREKLALIAEVNLSHKKINLEKLKFKAKGLANQLQDDQITYVGLALETMLD